MKKLYINVYMCVYFTRKLLYRNIFQQYFMHDIKKKNALFMNC